MGKLAVEVLELLERLAENHKIVVDEGECVRRVSRVDIHCDGQGKPDGFALTLEETE